MASGDGVDAIELVETTNAHHNVTTATAHMVAESDVADRSAAALSSAHNGAHGSAPPARITLITLNKKPETVETADTEIETQPHLAPNTIVAALPATTSRQLFRESALAHGGDEASSFIQQEMAVNAATQQRLRSASSTLDATVSRNPSILGSGGGGKHEKKIGHRRVDEGGEVTYKKIQSKQIMGSIQLGIQHTVGSLASKPKRDLLMNDFWEMETISFPPDGSSLTPAHHYSDFRFKVYAPIAFRYFRDLFGIAPDDFLMSMCAAPLLQLSNPGASGSIFYLTNDDEFIIKTVQRKECEFLQKLLPGYYMNLSQNPRTLLPKFFGLYCFHYNAKNVRLVAMNNLLPSEIKMHAKYDLKGSTFRRKASKQERQKASPTYKDLDFMEHHPNGIFLETDKYNALMKTIQRDCMVLESFQIMDYSLLVGVHNLDLAQKEKREERIRNARAKLQRAEERDRDMDADAPLEADQAHLSSCNATPIAAALTAASTSLAALAGGSTALHRSRSMNRQRLVAHSTAMESITADMDAPLEEDEDVPAGGIPARSENDERLILYIGIIDILQSYRLEKKLEHTFKSIIYNGDTVSVCRPSFYAQRFQNFMGKTVFKKTPTFPLKHSPSKRKTSTATTMRSTPSRAPSQLLSAAQLRPIVMSGSSTPPPAFDDISEEDLTSSSNANAVRNSSSQSRRLAPQRYQSSSRSVISGGTDDAEASDSDEPLNGVYISRTQLAPSPSYSPRRAPSQSSVQVRAVEEIVRQELHVDAELAAAGKQEPQQQQQEFVPSSKTTVIRTAVQAQTYTTTLVLSDVS